MKQFQIDKTDFSNTRFVEAEVPVIDEGEILLKVERFGLSANNITYAVAGDTLGYWQFFQPSGDGDNWGMMPVWGFAEVVGSTVPELEIGERLFGYFPPASYAKMKAIDVSDTYFFDGSEHRAHLPKGYNIYRRLNAEQGYDRMGDDIRMLLYPLYVTSFVIWDQLAEHHFYDAERVVIVSASSKTSIGLAYALKAKNPNIHITGLTSPSNVSFVESLGIYHEAIPYDELEDRLDRTPTAIVDMAGNADVLGRLHTHLADDMKQTLSVGLTHWEAERRSSNVIKDRTEFFFAPSRIQKRMKDWGAAEFNKQSSEFILDTAMKSSAWLNLITLQGLDGLASVYGDVLSGEANPSDGFLIEM